MARLEVLKTYKIWERLNAARSDQPPKAFLAATIAFLTSFFEDKQTLPKTSPFEFSKL